MVFWPILGKVKQLEALADGIMDASLVIFAERRKRPQELQYQWWVDRQFGKIHRGLRFSEDFKWQDRYPHLAIFYVRTMERPSFRDTVPVL